MTGSSIRSAVLAASKGSTALACLAFFVAAALATQEQTPSKQDQPQARSGGDAQTRASTKEVRVTDLRGDYDWHRTNNDLLYYHLDIRGDPERKSFDGKNTVKFRMLKNDCRIHLDRRLAIDKILLGETPLKSKRDACAVFAEFPGILRQGEVYYSDTAAPAGSPSARTPRAGPGSCRSAKAQASVWWPNKDFQFGGLNSAFVDERHLKLRRALAIEMSGL